jgi:transcription initiation factor TFIID TATA-box-binding protein
MSKADDAKKTIKIENIVASTAIGQEIDLKSLTVALDGADYDPERLRSGKVSGTDIQDEGP